MADSTNADKDAVMWSARTMADGQLTDEHQADALAALMASTLRQGIY